MTGYVDKNTDRITRKEFKVNTNVKIMNKGDIFCFDSKNIL